MFGSADFLDANITKPKTLFLPFDSSLISTDMAKETDVRGRSHRYKVPITVLLKLKTNNSEARCLQDDSHGV